MHTRTAVEMETVEGERVEGLAARVAALLILLPALVGPNPWCRHCAAGVPRPHVLEAFAS
jgi:hypothetical protein